MSGEATISPGLQWRYLGDGVYASFDGFHVILHTPRVGGDHWVALDPGVLVEFERYLSRLREERKAT